MESEMILQIRQRWDQTWGFQALTISVTAITAALYGVVAAAAFTTVSVALAILAVAFIIIAIPVTAINVAFIIGASEVSHTNVTHRYVTEFAVVFVATVLIVILH